MWPRFCVTLDCPYLQGMIYFHDKIEPLLNLLILSLNTPIIHQLPCCYVVTTLSKVGSEIKNTTQGFPLTLLHSGWHFNSIIHIQMPNLDAQLKEKPDIYHRFA